MVFVLTLDRYIKYVVSSLKKDDDLLPFYSFFDAIESIWSSVEQVMHVRKSF